MLKDFARYFNRYLWRTVSLRDYTNRKREPPPFATLIPTGDTIDTRAPSEPRPPAIQEAVHIKTASDNFTNTRSTEGD